MTARLAVVHPERVAPESHQPSTRHHPPVAARIIQHTNIPLARPEQNASRTPSPTARSICIAQSTSPSKSKLRQDTQRLRITPHVEQKHLPPSPGDATSQSESRSAAHLSKRNRPSSTAPASRCSCNDEDSRGHRPQQAPYHTPKHAKDHLLRR